MQDVVSKKIIIPQKLARQLVLDELFDLTLYRRMSSFASGDTQRVLETLIPIETNHLKFWQDLFGMPLDCLNFMRRIKLAAVLFFARISGEAGIHLALEAIEVHGIRKYLSLWEIYQNHPLGSAVREVLYDEFKHEDRIISEVATRKLHPERVRDIFLGFNDGLVEILGAVSGFFAAFQTSSSVLIAGLTVAVAGSVSMAAGVFAAVGSEREVKSLEVRKRRFLNEATGEEATTNLWWSAVAVGVSYFFGAMVPIVPVLLGSQNIFYSIFSASVVIILLSYALAFLSGMSALRRIGVNIIIVAIAVGVTYGIGTVAKTVWGVSI